LSRRDFELEYFENFLLIENLMQPGLSGNPFLLNLKFYLDGNRLQKRLRAEDGKAAQKILLKEIKIN